MTVPPGGPHGQQPFHRPPHQVPGYQDTGNPDPRYQEHRHQEHRHGYVPGSPHSQSQYGQQQYGQPQYWYPSGFAVSPPVGRRRSRIGVWLAVSIPALLLAAFLVTGLGVPGFLRRAAPLTTHDGQAAGPATPHEVAVALVDGVNNRDRSALHDITCAGAGKALDRNIAHVRMLRDARLSRIKRISPDKALARLSITLDGTRMLVRTELRREHGGWCWNGWSAAGELAHI